MSATREHVIAQLPTPGWGPLTEDFWLAAGRGELVVQQCSACEAHRWTPTWACYSCSSTDWSWAVMPGTGTVFSYTWADRRQPGQDLYNVAIVELDGVNDEPVRLMTRVLDVDKDSLKIGLPVTVTFVPLAEGIAIPFFRPQRNAASPETDTGAAGTG